MADKVAPSGARAASMVGLGILLSRIMGLVRETVFAHYFGSGVAADAVKAAYRIPNLLQNLFGEGALSASFIPVYAGLLARGERREADRVAGAVASLLALAVAVLVLIGVLATPVIIDLIAPGFTGERRVLTIRLVRIFFPGAGLLAISAWCLGVLNSHRQFLLSYASTAVANAVMIVTLLIGGPGTAVDHLAVIYAWGSVLASAVTFGVQLPAVLRSAPGIRPRWDTASAEVRTVARNFGPAFVSRGVVQLSSYVDQFLASWLPIGSVALLGYGQILATLPVSLFGVAVSAAELPSMSGATGTKDEVAAYLRGRLDDGLGRIAFLVIPSAMGFLVLGDVMASLLFRSGRFTADDARWVWAILAGSAVGLLASTLGRLYSSTYFALRDTRTPLRFAVVRVALTTALGALCAFPVPHWLGVDPRWGMAGLTASAGVAGWVEFTLLRRTLNRRIGPTGLRASLVAKLWASAAVAAGLAYAVAIGPRVTAVAVPARLWSMVVLGVYGAAYLALTAVVGVGDTGSLWRRARRMFGGAR
jgi:putative peptidoglycan lipid II flippase